MNTQMDTCQHGMFQSCILIAEEAPIENTYNCSVKQLDTVDLPFHDSHGKEVFRMRYSHSRNIEHNCGMTGYHESVMDRPHCVREPNNGDAANSYSLSEGVQ